MNRKRILSLAAALGLLAFLIPATAGTALAWAPPTITVVCPQVLDIDQGGTDFNWYVSLHGIEPDYGMEWSTNGTDWNGPIDWSDQNDPLAGGGWGGPITTTSFADNGGDHLWVRWASDHNSVAGPVFNECPSQSPTEAPPTEAPSEAPSTAPSATPGQTAVDCVLTDCTFAPTPTPGLTLPPTSTLDTSSPGGGVPPLLVLGLGLFIWVALLLRIVLIDWRNPR